MYYISYEHTNYLSWSWESVQEPDLLNQTSFKVDFCLWCVCICMFVYLNADNSHDDVVIICAAPAQDIGSFFISLQTEFMNGILCAVQREQTKLSLKMSLLKTAVIKHITN